ncbi:hypothetical protein JRI60_38180 [Archangium violaceum]|uniref:hypothetical protein n=1 Tax=Archangium violaceum TaxID=83451 RepID=UPI00195088BC|nr:hypothetical protein [Archangium violaceum]QRN94892.1 hypothetical protein JRI60_38180 [Archangium violaceum]
MVLNVKTRLVLAGAVVGVSLLALASANAQFDPSTGAPVSPGTPQTSPGVSPTTPQPFPDYNSMNGDGGMGGSGLDPMPSIPSLFGQDAGTGGSGGLLPPPTLEPLDAGLR